MILFSSIHWGNCWFCLFGAWRACWVLLILTTSKCKWCWPCFLFRLHHLAPYLPGPCSPPSFPLALPVNTFNVHQFTSSAGKGERRELLWRRGAGRKVDLGQLLQHLRKRLHMARIWLPRGCLTWEVPCKPERFPQLLSAEVVTGCGHQWWGSLTVAELLKRRLVLYP